MMAAAAQLRLAVMAMFDAPVAARVTDPQAAQPALLPGESDAVVAAIPGRQREFAAGRSAARLAMADLGRAPAAIPAGPDRAPVWPPGLAGSISHTKAHCLAVLGRTSALASLGVDIEPAVPLGADLIPLVCSDAERGRIAGPESGMLAKLIFSAKEAIFKAQYPITGQLFGFDQLDLALDSDSDSFVATFLKPALPFRIGDRLAGRYTRVGDHLVTAVAIGQDDGNGGLL